MIDGKSWKQRNRIKALNASLLVKRSEGQRTLVLTLSTFHCPLVKYHTTGEVLFFSDSALTGFELIKKGSYYDK